IDGATKGLEVALLASDGLLEAIAEAFHGLGAARELGHHILKALDYLAGEDAPDLGCNLLLRVGAAKKPTRLATNGLAGETGEGPADIGVAKLLGELRQVGSQRLKSLSGLLNAGVVDYELKLDALVLSLVSHNYLLEGD